MKQEFSKVWKASKQPRKQRKYRANAPQHIKQVMVTANLNKDLRKKYGRRNFPVIKGDNVKVLRGNFKNKVGKITEVDLTKLRVSVEGLQRQKKDGTKVNVYFDPSKIQIQELELKDSKRERRLKKESGKVEKEDKVSRNKGEKNNEN